MSLPYFEIYRPKNLDEALEFLKKYGEKAKPLAGGTELLIHLRNRVIKPKYLVDLSSLKTEFSYVYVKNKTVHIGALTTLWELNNSFLGRDKRYAGFVDVFKGFGTMALRFEATIGGNIVSATQYSDYITLLLTYNASVKIKSLEKERIVKLEDFLIDKRKTDLKPDELVVEIMFEEPGDNCSSSFMKFDRRKLLIAGIVTNATYLCLENNKITDIRISFDMIKDKKIPGRARKTEEFLKGREFSEDIIIEAVEKILPQEISRLSDWWTSAEYRFEMSKIVLRRNLLRTYERIKR